MQWKDKLYDYEVTPPEHVWNKIVHDLDNEFIVFKEKLQHVETTPPAHVWNNIVHDLDNDFILFKEKLQHTVIAPPANAWNNIQSLLDNSNEVKVAPVISMRRVLRIAAAAAVVGILFFTANYFINNRIVQPQNNTAVNQNTSPSASPATSNTTRGNNSQNTQQPKQQSLIASAYQPKKQKAANADHIVSEEIYSDGGTYNLSPSIAAVNETPAAVTDQHDLSEGFDKYVRNSKGEIREDVTLLDLPNSYFMMTGPDGQSIRVSSKFRNTIQYLNGSGNEELLDVILRESRYWKNIFSGWKEQLNNSSFIPSTNNFMDIAELMQLLHVNARK
ncbi:MAG: hypothetical protein QM802_25150 [Agriterribacter sp.]